MITCQRSWSWWTCLGLLLQCCCGAPARAEAPTHAAAKDVVIRGEQGETLQTFCLGPDGRIYALLAKPVVYGAEESTQSSGRGEVRVLDADGKQLSAWSVEFTPQRIAAAPSGEIIVGGGGRLARFDADGKLLGSGESPHLASVLADKDALRKAAEEQHRSSIESYTEQLKQFEEQFRQLEAAAKKKKEEAKKKDQPGASDKKDKGSENKPAASGGFRIFSLFSTEVTVVGGGDVEVATFNDDPDAQLQMMRQTTEMWRRMLADEEKRSVEDVMREITARLQRIHGIAVGKDEIYVATAMSKGYGFAVWRMSLDLQNAKQIITGLSGCCGQIDVQCRDDQLFVAENSRHRVVSYDREGKRLTAWGKRDRDGEGGGFGGCCNPMNLCFLADGAVVTSESEGLVKRFSASGEFLGLIGKAKVGGGCKNVAVAASRDGERVYFYDLQGSKIIILSAVDGARPGGATAATGAGE